MNPPPLKTVALVAVAVLLGFGLISATLFWNGPIPAAAQTQAQPQSDTGPARTNAVPPNTSTNAAGSPPAQLATGSATNQPTVATPASAAPADQTTAATNQPAATTPAPPETTPGTALPEEIQLSFRGANIDMIVQWLAETSGKSVVKHPRVQCQLTIISSRKLPTRQAINLVYRALNMEGFTAVETDRSILIVPEGQEPRMSPELLESSRTELPEGRQRLVKIFEIQQVLATDIRDRIRSLLSDKGTIEVDERGNKLIVTDYTENLRLLTELIPELDVASVSDSVVEIFTLKFAEAQDLADLLGVVLNDQASRQAPSPGASSSGPTPAPPSPEPGGATAQAGRQVRLWPDRTSNRLIIAAPKSRMQEIKDLLTTLDTQKPADVGVRVIQLHHVDAAALVREIAPLYQKMSGRSLKETIEVTANTRSNSLIVLSNEANYEALRQLIAALDTEQAQEKILQAFPLKNADAEDVAEQLRELYQGQSTTARYVYYFSDVREDSKKISFVADRRRNTVIVQAPPGAIPGIADMIEALDEPVADNALAPRIFSLKYVSALDIEDVLNELFLKREERRDYWDFYYGSSQETDRDVGRLFGKIRITSEPYSNSIIVTSNSPENFSAVEDILKQLDVPSQAGETTLRVGLKFANAVTVASSINILFARGGSPPLRPQATQFNPNDPRNLQQQGSSYQTGFELEREVEEESYYPWLGGQQENYRTSGDDRTGIRPVSDLVGRVRVVPDRRTNSLLITSNVHFFPQVLKLINELDTATPQVLIEAKIVEVSSDFRDRLGVRWSPDGSQIFDQEDLDDSIIGSGAAKYTEVFAGSAVANSLRTGILDATVNLDLLIQFLRKTTGATVLAEPQVNVADNEMGKLFVGSQVPFISSSLNTDEGGRNDAFQYKDVGVILEVTPHINNSDEVALKIRVESSNIRNGQTLFGGAILDTRNFRTDLVVKSGQTLVLGGIIQKEDVETIRKVPILGSIPGLGWAFKKKDTVTRRVELMVFLRPRITRTPEEARQLVEEIERRTPQIQKWRENTPATTP